MMFITFSLTFSNVLNLIFGAIFGFILMAMFVCMIISHRIKKHNAAVEIRSISNDVYKLINEEKTSKDKLVKALMYESRGVTSLIYPDKKFPLYELSINDIFDGIALVQYKLKQIDDNPMMNNLRDIHIATLLQFNNKVIKPVMKVKKHTASKVLLAIYNVVWTILNLINPIFYIKKILKYTVMRKGKKDVILALLDGVGNTIYEIYDK